LLHFADVGRVQHNLTTVLPEHLSRGALAAVELPTVDEDFLVQDPAKLFDGRSGVLKEDLVDQIALIGRHVHGDHQPHPSLLTTVPSIFFFHLECRPPGRGLRLFFAPMWRWWIRLTFAISGASTAAVWLRWHRRWATNQLLTSSTPPASNGIS